MSIQIPVVQEAVLYLLYMCIQNKPYLKHHYKEHVVALTKKMNILNEPSVIVFDIESSLKHLSESVLEIKDGNIINSQIIF